MKMDIVRVERSEAGTFGVLIVDGSAFCVTLERPWVDNQQNVSSIPPGDYICKRVQSPSKGNTFEITGVPGRSNILIHKGNFIGDSEGCVLVGQYFAKLKHNGDSERAIANSGTTFTQFLQITDGQSQFDLTVHGAVVSS
ncbi:DUF5675 family protein [Desulfovibrio mangrovi]|uniref:DUF5675 family protein n=1 Tax=Desulfovibrio mangrovi TaxID=2976983 RepID=UPI002247FBEB|nr:DUF5675 family protein [Desulfovibrio mangrovi]UZP68091.1 DUF5675 family protein [Desulfovibrio mangrovi]